jgi:hypothetical protein
VAEKAQGSLLGAEVARHQTKLGPEVGGGHATVRMKPKNFLAEETLHSRQQFLALLTQH